MLIYVFLKAMSKFLAKFLSSKKTILHTSTFFAFIKIVIFLLPFFKIRIVLNCNSLLYFNAV